MKKREDKHFIVSAIAAALTVSVPTVIAGISAASAVVGTGATVMSQQAAMEAAEKQQAASERAEKIRKAQMEAEAREARIRAERERRINVARTTASATNAGAGPEGSVWGAMGTALSTAATNDRQAGTALTHGQQMFEANRDYSIAGGEMQQALGTGQMIAGVAAGFGSLASIGTSLFNQNNMGSWTTTTQKAPA